MIYSDLILINRDVYLFNGLVDHNCAVTRISVAVVGY